MFGSGQQQQGTGFGSTGGAFGSGGTGFGGSTPGFGSTGTTGTGLFGQQPAAQQQQSAFGSAAGGFGSAGGFGAASKPSPFGTQTSTSGGLFGSTPSTSSAFGGGGFGATSSATSAFGSTATSGGLFGAKPAAGGGMFGGTTGGTMGGFGAAAASATAPPAQGTATVAFQPFQEKDPTSTTMNHFQTISFMPAYKNFSLEELRSIDYLQGRKFPDGQSGAFGQPTGFGGAQTGFGQPASTSFGAAAGGGLFGQQPASTSSAFGSTPAPSGFGGAASTGLFGQKPGGLFGSTPATTQPATGGLFGTSPATGFGATSGSAFGATQPTAGGGLFGQPKPAGFGATPSTGFGASSTGFSSTGAGFGQPQQPATGGGLFGTQPQQPQQVTSLFGQTPQQPSTGFGASGAFGQQQPQQAGSAFGSGFGASQAQPKPLFGAQPAAPAGGLFGQTQTQQPAPAAGGGGLFGRPLGTPQASGSLFGQPQPAQQPSGLFGQSAAPSQTGGLFGSNPQQTAGGSLFGQSQPKQAAGGLFGTQPTQQQGGGLFGSIGQTQQQPQQGLGLGGGSLFGNPLGSQQQPQQGLGLGSTFQSGLGSSLFQQQPQQQQIPQQSQYAPSLNDNPYGQNPLFQSVGGTPQAGPIGPIATPLSNSTNKTAKKSAIVPSFKFQPRQSSFTPRFTKSLSRSGSPFAVSTSAGSTPMAGSLSVSMLHSYAGGSLGRAFSKSSSAANLFSDGDDVQLNYSAFTPTGKSSSLKRLVVDKRIRDSPNDFFAVASPRDSLQPRDNVPKSILKKVSFDSTAEKAGKLQDLFGASSRNSTESSPNLPESSPLSASEMGFMRSSQGPKKLKEPLAPSSSVNGSATPEPSTDLVIRPTSREDSVEETDYWMKPSLAQLKKFTKEDLKEVTNLSIGRTGFGKVTFETAVDLTTFKNLNEIMGNCVLFSRKSCTVYAANWEKPKPGIGLNVPAIIELEGCYPKSRDKGAEIKDPKHPRMVSHIQRLKSIPDTEFLEYKPATGTWTFKVEHFTTYGLDDDTDVDSEYEATPTNGHGALVDVEEDDEEDTSVVDDTFDFKRLARKSQRTPFPGTFGEQDETEDAVIGDDSFDADEGDEGEESFIEGDSFMTEDGEQTADGADETTTHDFIFSGTPAISRHQKRPSGKIGKDWLAQLEIEYNQYTEREKAMRIKEQQQSANGQTVKPTPSNEFDALVYTHADLANDLFGGKTAKVVGGKASKFQV